LESRKFVILSEVKDLLFLSLPATMRKSRSFVPMLLRITSSGAFEDWNIIRKLEDWI